MALVSQVVRRFLRAAGARGLLGLAGCLAVGCVSDKMMTVPPLIATRDGPSQIVARWNNTVGVSPDPVHGGRPQAGLVGRVYLFGPKMDIPLEGDGTLTVELFNPAEHGRDGGPKLIEKWIISPQDFHRLKRPDVFGNGYSLFLPWGTYRPDLTEIHLRVCFQQKTGAPLYANSGLLKLGDGGVLQTRASNYSVAPGAQAAASGPAQGQPLAQAGLTPPPGAGRPLGGLLSRP